MNEPKIGALRVWHIPQVPGKPFYVVVDTPLEAQRVLIVLALYDLFQIKERIKPHYYNASGLEQYVEDDGDGKPDGGVAGDQRQRGGARPAGIGAEGRRRRRQHHGEHHGRPHAEHQGDVAGVPVGDHRRHQRTFHVVVEGGEDQPQPAAGGHHQDGDHHQPARVVADGKGEAVQQGGNPETKAPSARDGASF